MIFSTGEILILDDNKVENLHIQVVQVTFETLEYDLEYIHADSRRKRDTFKT